MEEVRIIQRPEIVHQFKAGDGKQITTKCGLTARKNSGLATTPWSSEVTCEECNP